jgi:hypothetical protein
LRGFSYVNEPTRTTTAQERPAAKEMCGLVAAYREGLALVAIVVAQGPERISVAAAEPNGEASTEAGPFVARWWCGSAAEAEQIVAAAAATLRRQQSRAHADDSAARDAARLASDCVLASAKQLNAVLRSDEELHAEANNALVRVDAEMAKLQQCGGLKSVNQAYRSYRLAASARGERIVRYGEWMMKYRENLLRQVAATLRHI